MKSDARFILNKKRQNAKNHNSQKNWKAPSFKSQGNFDARNVINVKRKMNKPNNPVLGTFMRTKTLSGDFISKIKKEVVQATKAPDKTVELSKDGNLIIKAVPKMSPRKLTRSSSVQPMEVDSLSSRRYLQSTSSMFPSPEDDLEHTTLEDLLDVQSLPSTLVSSNSFPSANLSRNSSLSQMVESRRSMVADQLARPASAPCAKVYASNLHPSVTQEDILELFGDIGPIKAAEILMPGTAVIDFYNAADAQRACATYHNRLLDGLPMKCHLQAAKPQSQQTTISQRLGNRVLEVPNPVRNTLPVTVNPRSRYNPRNVKFTVKLA